MAPVGLSDLRTGGHHTKTGGWQASSGGRRFRFGSLSPALSPVAGLFLLRRYASLRGQVPPLPPPNAQAVGLSLAGWWAAVRHDDRQGSSSRRIRFPQAIRRGRRPCRIVGPGLTCFASGGVLEDRTMKPPLSLGALALAFAATTICAKAQCVGG